MSQMETLERLAKAPVGDLVTRDEHGNRQILYHYQACCNARLTADIRAKDDIARLHALCGVAVSHGLASWVVDYVQEICCDPTRTSSDENEADLYDGESVSSWCLTALKHSETCVKGLLRVGLANPGAPAALRREIGRVNGLAIIVKALYSTSTAQSGLQGSMNGDNAKRLQQTLKVMDWARLHGLHESRGGGRHASAEEWRLAVHRRRDAAQPDATFLQDSLSSLAEKYEVSSPIQYPPSRLEGFLEGVFMQGATSQAAVVLKAKVFMYYLLDTGHASLLESFRLTAGLTEDALCTSRLHFLLDEAAREQPGTTSFDTLCSILPGSAPSEISFKMIRALASLGAGDIALELLKCTSKGAGRGTDEGLSEVLAAVQILLYSRHVSQAYIEIREHCRVLSGSTLEHHTEALISELATWAAENKAMGRVLQLPFIGLEEEAFVKYLRGSPAAAAAEHLALFYLLRQRCPEALTAHSQLAKAGKASAYRSVFEEMLQKAAQSLPEAQRSLVLHPEGASPRISLHSLGTPDQPGIPVSAQSGAPMHEGVALHTSGSGAVPPPLFGPLISGGPLPRKAASPPSPPSGGAPQEASEAMATIPSPPNVQLSGLLFA